MGRVLVFSQDFTMARFMLLHLLETKYKQVLLILNIIFQLFPLPSISIRLKYVLITILNIDACCFSGQYDYSAEYGRYIYFLSRWRFFVFPIPSMLWRFANQVLRYRSAYSPFSSFSELFFYIHWHSSCSDICVSTSACLFFGCCYKSVQFCSFAVAF